MDWKAVPIIQIEIKDIASGSFEFRNTRNGKRIRAHIMRQLDARKLTYYTYHPKALKSVNDLTPHLPRYTPAKDITNEMVELGFSVIIVRQISTSRSQLQGGFSL